MDKIFDVLKKHKGLAVVIAFFAVIFPMAIVQILFKWKSGIPLIESEWSAGEALTYIVGAEAFIGTMAFSMLTYYQNRVIQKENDIAQSRLQDAYDKVSEANAAMAEAQQLLTKTQEQMQTLTAQANNISLEMLKLQKQQYKPLLFVRKMNTIIRNTLGIPDESETESYDSDETDVYKEVLPYKYYIIVGDEIDYKTKLTKEQSDRIKSFYRCEHRDKNYHYSINNVFYIPLVVRNIGFGPCSDVRFSLFKHREISKWVLPFSLMNGEDFYIGIYADLDIESVLDTYTLEFLYRDIFLNQYKQKYEFRFFKENGDSYYEMTIQTDQSIEEHDL